MYVPLIISALGAYPGGGGLLNNGTIHIKRIWKSLDKCWICPIYKKLLYCGNISDGKTAFNLFKWKLRT